MTWPFTGRDERWSDDFRESPSDARGEATSGLDRWSAPALMAERVTFGLDSRRPADHSPTHDLGDHLATFGPRPDARGEGGSDLLAALADVGLTGHGGGHVPVALKWRTARTSGAGGLVVANCAESEPASRKDAALLQLRPHLVLDGLNLTAEATQAREAVIWLHESDRSTQRVLRTALAERSAAIGPSIPIRIALAPQHYLSGESSTIVRALSGGPALPYLARSHAAAHGVQGRPTVVHNAETLARIALVARFGPQQPLDGPLVTVTGRRWRVVLAAGHGETFAGLVARSGVANELPQAVLVGGYGGSWLPWDSVAHREVSNRALSAVHASLGAGVVVPLEVHACGLAETAAILRFLAASSARQCGPCLFGLPAVTDLFSRLAEGRSSRGEVRTLQRYADEVSGRGACHHPDGAVRLARSALSAFRADVERHLRTGPCPGRPGQLLLTRPQVV